MASTRRLVGRTRAWLANGYVREESTSCLACCWVSTFVDPESPTFDTQPRILLDPSPFTLPAQQCSERPLSLAHWPEVRHSWISTRIQSPLISCNACRLRRFVEGTRKVSIVGLVPQGPRAQVDRFPFRSPTYWSGDRNVRPCRCYCLCNSRHERSVVPNREN